MNVNRRIDIKPVTPNNRFTRLLGGSNHFCLHNRRKRNYNPILMASTPEFIPIGSQKHDPAWKHCQMIKCGDRTQLKCIYCGKVFSGGGIHRIKEHLAGQKGNAASCLRVHADVRLSMQQSLDGVVVKKKKKKQKIAEDIRNLTPAINKVENTFVNQNEVDSGLQLLALPNAVDSNSCFPAKEEGFIKSPERRKRGRPKNISPPPTTSDAHPIGKLNSGSLKAKDQEWLDCPYSKKPISVQMTDLFCSQTFWSHCITIIRLTQPLVRILRMVDSNKKPAMGFIYGGMYHAKETIKKELKKKEDYMPYWNIIDWRWDRQLHSPLHAAGFFLNPHFFCSIQGDVHTEVMSGMLDCIERLVPDIKIQDKINKELSSYKNASGDFGRKMAIRARNSLFPADWWSTYGGGCPNLTRLAIRILSQTCSTSGCNRDLIPVELIHGRKRNRLEHQRLYDLVFVQYNLRLQQRKLLRNKPFDPISHDNIDHLEDWVVVKEPFLEENGDLDWIALDQPIANTTNSEFTSDEPEGLDTGFDDEEIYNIGIDEEEDDDNGS
ncbi:hypothetical protein MRB53_019079 [Persea americana]|uniref:Uncharacterized protein n=1 Tax=Persea americana TaxID=3435 RepID=A0ACC2M9Q7_PERAE|nr:hypothetical protein MRB53_019079 [Persea americana]